jgi:hypothetical protein
MTMVTVTSDRRDGISPLAPAYYLGRPARVWFEALRRPRRPSSIPAGQSAITPARVEKSSSSAALSPARRAKTEPARA